MFATRARHSSGGIFLLYLGETTDETDLTEYTFSSKALGVATTNRTIIVGVLSGNSPVRTIVSVTVGGVTGTERAFVSNGTILGYVGIYTVEVPTGTTGDIVVTFSGSCGRCQIVWWKMIGHQSSTPAATNTGSATDSTLEFTLAPSVGNATIGIGIGEVSSDALSWSQISTERLDADAESLRRYGAADEFPDSGGANPVLTSAGTNKVVVGAVATWK